MEWFKRFSTHFKSILPSLSVALIIWLVLEVAACMGFHPVVFWPFYFLSGALAGITTSSAIATIGGAVGRAVIFIFFEKAIWILLFSKKPVKERFTETGKLLAKKLAYLIPYVKKLKSLFTKDLTKLGAEAVGIGTAIILSYWLSGDGKLVNSFASIALLTTIAGELQLHKGLIYSTVKKLSDYIRSDTADSFLTGHSFGFGISVLMTNPKLMMICGSVLTALGIFIAAADKVKNKKTG